MPGRVLLDTNVIIAFFAKDKSVSHQVAAHEILVTSTVLGELYYGAHKSGQTATNLARIHEWAKFVQVLSCDEITAEHFGRIKNLLRLKGRPIPENDIWIAAVAQQYGLPLATRDEHFKAVDGLAIDNW